MPPLKTKGGTREEKREEGGGTEEVARTPIGKKTFARARARPLIADAAHI